MIAILLSTYNGEPYLKTQLDSLLAQSYKEFKIIARDDGSSDKTVEILNSYAIEILPSTGNLGVKGSFTELLNYAILHTNAQYFMFCDQDDVWHTDKIEKTYQNMQALEAFHSQSMPLLIHTNLSVVDKALHVKAHSLWQFQHVNPTKISFHNFIANNNITGCTMMLNRALAEKVKMIPNEAIMHDWWIAMVASIFGKIAYINEPLILYRQHGANDTGAKKYGWGYFIKKIGERPSLDRYLAQAEKFLYLYEDTLDANSKEMLLVLKEFNSFGKFKKIKVIIKYKLWKNGIIRNLGLLINA